MGRKHTKLIRQYIDLINWSLEAMNDLKSLRTLKKNLDSGVCVNISPELIELLMLKDWTNG